MNRKILWVFLISSVSLLARCFAADFPYIVREDIVDVFDQIQETIPEPATVFKCTGEQHKAIIYGNLVMGHPSKVNSKWIETSSPHGFVVARGLTKDVNYQKIGGQFLIANEDINVRLLPKSDSKGVLTLLKGEVLPVTGKFDGADGAWFRFEFKSIQSDFDSYAGEIPVRVGWIASKDVTQLDPNLNQGTLQYSEIPSKMRGDTVYSEGDQKASPRIYSDSEKKYIAQKGFYSQKAGLPRYQIYIDDMADLYRGVRGPVFLTSDVYLHSFHLIFDRMLQDIETKRLLPSLKDLTQKMYQLSESRLTSANSDLMREAAKRNMWFFGVGGKLMDENFALSPTIQRDVDKEIQKIMNTDVALPSEGNPSQEHEYLPGFKEDYTQYKPRGHYTINKDLETYFRVMMHYGRKTFPLKDQSCTLSAIMMTKDLKSSNLLQQWQTFSIVIDQLVGKTDDPSPKDYLAVMNGVAPQPKVEPKSTEEPSWYEKAKTYVKEKISKEPTQIVVAKQEPLTDFSTPEKIQQFIDRAKKDLPPQRIVSQQTGTGKTQGQRLEETTGFKFFGQRYTADAEFFQRLTSPNVGSDDHPKNLPSALEVMALLGSKEAKNLMPKEWWKSVDNYSSQYQKLKLEVDAYSTSRWDESAYMGWLYTLNALFLPPESKQFFVNAGAWGYKTLNAALASWTELKHDTILYAEQSYAESGDGGDCVEIPPAEYAPPSIKGYVEPVPTFFNRLAHLNSRIIQLLGESQYLTDEYKNKLTTFGELSTKAEELAKKEINGNQITEDEYAWIRSMPSRLDRGLLLPSDIGDIVDEKYLKMALVADVATDAFGGQVLTEAIGYPQEIHVLTKDYWGGTRIAKGYIYTQYEFADTKRWNDDEWKELVYSSDKQDDLKKMEHKWVKEFQKPLSR